MQKKRMPEKFNFQVSVIDIQYFPSIPFFTLLAGSRKVLFETHENFVKQTYRNRCRILTANGVEDLVIPLRKPYYHIPITEVRIDNRQDWAGKHQKAIQSAYGKAPWFFQYKDAVREILYSGKHYLAEFNLYGIELCLKLLGMDVKTGTTDKFEKILPDNITDFRSLIHPKKKTEDLAYYRPVKYSQNFGPEFVPSLSVMDLIFSEGPRSADLLIDTLVTENLKLN
jgi:hypothetical protein